MGNSFYNRILQDFIHAFNLFSFYQELIIKYEIKAVTNTRAGKMKKKINQKTEAI